MDPFTLYEQIHPEYKTMNHGISFYQGLRELGLKSLRSARRAGYVIVRDAHPNGVWPRLFIHKRDIHQLHALADEITIIREKREEVERRQEVEDQRRRRDQLDIVLKEYCERHGKLASDEMACVQDYTLHCRLKKIRLDEVERVLEQHRVCLNQLKPGEIPPKQPLCSCPWCEAEWRESQSRLQGELREALQPWDRAREELGELLDHTTPEKVEKAFAKAVRESYKVVTKNNGDGDISLHEVLAERFDRKLAKIRRKCRRHRQRDLNLAQMETFYQEKILPQLEAEERELQGICRSYDIGENVLDQCRTNLKEFMDTYQGQGDFDRSKKQLLRIVDEVRLVIEETVKMADQRSKLEEVYQANSDFAQYFPKARNLNRKLFFYVGPTNSGKTHCALDLLAASDSGVYLAPLRLMALEGQESLQDRGVATSYLTGEERDFVDGARFLSCTIEMLDFHQRVDRAVIDEIQMMSHPTRGSAWINALVGVPASEVILTGSADALPLVEKIAGYLDEPLEIRHFERFNPLEMEDGISTLDQGDLEPGTAIICFSRRDVLYIKREVERYSPYRASVIYGGLSPDVRRDEARRFREGKTQILVATDAVSMGLNLPIRTILFWKTEKYYNQEFYDLTQSEIKQIAGRAGRYGIEDRGFVGAFSYNDLKRVRKALKRDLPDLAGPCPTLPHPLHLKLISQILETTKLVPILEYFQREIWFTEDLFESKITPEMFQLADELDGSMANVSLQNKYVFVCAPVDTASPEVVDSLIHWAVQYAHGEEIRLSAKMIIDFNEGKAQSVEELQMAEDNVKVATLYNWLAYRFPTYFPDGERAHHYRKILNQFISRSLSKGRLGR